VTVDLSGKITYLKVDRMLQLSQHAAILCGGAADGAEMCVALKNFIKEERLEDVQETYEAAITFLATEFERFIRKRCEVIPVDPIHQLYFVLGGYSPHDPHRPFRLYLLWTKRKLPKLDGDEISLAYTAPRLMGLEYRLNQLCQENTPLETMLAEVKKGMEQQAQRNEEIGPPFAVAFITKEGFREVS
jgi:hypothetical protein